MDIKDSLKELARWEPQDGNGVPFCVETCRHFDRDYGDIAPGLAWCHETATQTPDPLALRATVPCYAWALAVASLLREGDR
jgi:hypothetical protein